MIGDADSAGPSGFPWALKPKMKAVKGAMSTVGSSIRPVRFPREAGKRTKDSGDDDSNAKRLKLFLGDEAGVADEEQTEESTTGPTDAEKFLLSLLVASKSKSKKKFAAPCIRASCKAVPDDGGPTT